MALSESTLQRLKVTYGKEEGSVNLKIPRKNIPNSTDCISCKQTTINKFTAKQCRQCPKLN